MKRLADERPVEKSRTLEDRLSLTYRRILLIEEVIRIGEDGMRNDPRNVAIGDPMKADELRQAVHELLRNIREDIGPLVVAEMPVAVASWHPVTRTRKRS